MESNRGASTGSNFFNSYSTMNGSPENINTWPVHPFPANFTRVTNNAMANAQGAYLPAALPLVTPRYQPWHGVYRPEPFNVSHFDHQRPPVPQPTNYGALALKAIVVDGTNEEPKPKKEKLPAEKVNQKVSANCCQEKENLSQEFLSTNYKMRVFLDANNMLAYMPNVLPGTNRETSRDKGCYDISSFNVILKDDSLKNINLAVLKASLKISLTDRVKELFTYDSEKISVEVEDALKFKINAQSIKFNTVEIARGINGKYPGLKTDVTKLNRHPRMLEIRFQNNENEFLFKTPVICIAESRFKTKELKPYLDNIASVQELFKYLKALNQQTTVKVSPLHHFQAQPFQALAATLVDLEPSFVEEQHKRTAADLNSGRPLKKMKIMDAPFNPLEFAPLVEETDIIYAEQMQDLQPAHKETEDSEDSENFLDLNKPVEEQWEILHNLSNQS